MKKLLSFAFIALACVMIFSATACSNGSKSEAQSSDDSQPSDNSKMVVCYFSATGTTAAQAKRIADITGAEVYEIVPETLYSAADLDWTDSLSRSTVEMKDLSSRPALKDSIVDLTGYDIVLIGYPNWWNTAPRVINTFIEAANLDGKTVAAFMTSGSGDIDNSEKDLSTAYPKINWKKGLLMKKANEEQQVTDEQITEWVDSIAK